MLPLPTGSISWLSLTAAVITRGRRTSPAARAFRFTTFIRRIIDALSRVRTEGRQGRAASEPPLSVAIKYAPCVRTDGRTDSAATTALLTLLRLPCRLRSARRQDQTDPCGAAAVVADKRFISPAICGLRGARARALPLSTFLRYFGVYSLGSVRCSAND